MAFSLGITNQTIADILADESNLTANVNQSSHMDGAQFSLTDAYIFAEYGPKRDPLYIVIPITFVYMLIFVTGVVGNISTCIVISKNKSMHTATNYYLFSLAISDFLLLISGVPQEVYSIWSRYPYVFGELFCVVRGLMAGRLQTKPNKSNRSNFILHLMLFQFHICLQRPHLMPPFWQ